jgi:ABC-type multidrug transport system ATPase subunit
VSAAVEVEGVTKRFGGTLALNDVSFSVRPGEVLALLGPLVPGGGHAGPAVP